MVLQILVREPRYQRPSSAGATAAAHQSTGTVTPTSPRQQTPSNVTGAGAGAGGGGGGGGSRRPSYALTTPGRLPMAVIGTPGAAAPGGGALESPERYTQIVAVWQADCLLCGLSPFDNDTLVLLGYPVDEEEDEEEEGEEGVGEAGNGGGGGGRVWGGVGAVFQPEVQLVKRATGEVRKEGEGCAAAGAASAALGESKLGRGGWGGRGVL